MGDTGKTIALIKALSGSSNHDLSDDVKQAILQLANKVVYIDNGGSNYYDALYEAFYGNAPTPVSVSAVFAPGNVTFNPGTTLDDLKEYLTVTVTYSDESSASANSYTLSGSLSVGDNTITVIYGALSTTFTATITSLLPSGYTQLEYINSGEGYTDTGLNETQVARAEYKVMVTTVYYEKGNHILSANNTFFPYLSGSSTYGAYSQIRGKLKGSETVGTGSSSYSWEKDKIYTLEGYVGENNNGVKVNGESLFTLTAGNSVSSSTTFLLFACQANTGNGYRFHGRLYYMKIYDSNGDLIRNYIPCVNSSNVAGVYDTVTDTFLSSIDNSYAFIAGPAA